MKTPEEISSWGMPVVDAEGVPALRYRHVHHLHPPEAGALGATCFVAGNHAIKLLGTSDGLLFPYLMSGDIVSICGDPRGAPHGAGRLFLVEGGQPKPVVGPNSGLADHSDTVTAEYRFSPAYIEQAVSAGKLFIRYRVTMPWVNVPAMVAMYFVENRGDGTRWINLENLWDIAPCVLDARLMKAGLGKRLASSMGLGRTPVWNNSYYSISGQMAGQKGVVQFTWQDSVARKIGRKEPCILPNMVALPLSRNVTVAVDETPEALRPLLAVSDKKRPAASRSRISVSAKFAARPGELQIAATCFWFGDWEVGKREVRKLLPISMFPGNESILWKKRAPLRVEARDRDASRTLEWESRWFAGSTYASLWRDLADEERLVVAGDSCSTYIQGFPAHRLGTAVTISTLAFQIPHLAREVYLPWARRLQERIPVSPKQFKSVGYDLEDLLYTVWAGCELMAASGGRDDEVRTVVEGLAARALEILEQAELYGPNQLFSARWFWKDGFVGDKRPTDKKLILESVYLTAMAGAVLSWAAADFEQSASALADALTSKVLSLVGFLDSVGSSGRFPRWLATNGKAPDDSRILDHYVWLLFLPLEPKIRKPMMQLLRERMAEANVSGLNEDTMESTGDLDEETEPSGGRSGRRTGPLLNAMLLWSLGRADPAAALWLYKSTGIDNLLRSFPDGPYSAFGPGVGYAGGAQSTLTSGAGPDVATWFNHLSLCRTMATLKLFGIGPDSGGLYVRAYLLNHFSIDTGVLSMSQSGDKIRGCWTGVAETGKLVLDFDGLREGSRWEPQASDAVVSHAQRGYSLNLEVQSGKTWVLLRQ